MNVRLQVVCPALWMCPNSRPLVPRVCLISDPTFVTYEYHENQILGLCHLMRATAASYRRPRQLVYLPCIY